MINQKVKPEIQEGVRIVVVDAGHIAGAFTGLNSKFTGLKGTVVSVDRAFTHYQPDACIDFDNGFDGCVELQHLQVVQETTCGEAPTPKQPRVNYLYVVEDEDGAYVKTFDRGYAREVKAELGGKKAGVIITAYAAVKEIR